MVSGKRVTDGSVKPLAKVIGYSEGACAPIDFTIAPVCAVKRLLDATGVPKDSISRWEVNEAFSITALAFIKELGLDKDRVNARGGAVALGHPIGLVLRKINVKYVIIAVLALEL